MRRGLAALAIGIAATVAVGNAGADAVSGRGRGTGTGTGRGLEGLWHDINRAIDRAVADRARRPPVPVKVTWRERRLASLDLGAPLLALDAADLDGDGRAELVALTSQELLVLTAATAASAAGAASAASAPAVTLRARAPLGGDPAPIRPRDPVGSLVVERGGAEPVLWARSSERAEAAGLAWRAGALHPVGHRPGFPLCAGVTAALVPGRNYFDGGTVTRTAEAAASPAAAPLEPPAQLFTAACRDAVDPAGAPLSLSGLVTTDRVLQVRCRTATGGACAPGPAGDRDYPGAGVAFELADIDSDGHPEVLVTRGGAPGDRDRVTVHARRGEAIEKVFAKDFHAGIVGLIAADIDGDRDRDVVVAVRFAGSTHVSFWTLNR